MTRPTGMDAEHFGGETNLNAEAQFKGTMFDQAPESDRARLERDASIDARFKLFHMDNPHVYADLERRALGLLDAGTTHFGIAMLWEAMRFDAAMKSQGQAFALNNDHRSRYARLLIERHPQLRGVLEIRELRAS